MGRFSDRATRPTRGPLDIARWKLGRSEPPTEAFLEADDGSFAPRVVPNEGDAIQREVPHATWVGHATYVFRLGGQLVVTDPVWGKPLGISRRHSPEGLALDVVAAHLDVVLVSHSHRDHLDVATVRRLGSRPVYVAPLGNEKVLRAAGAERVVELDWWETHRHGDLEVTLVPARHWSMRTPFDRDDALWGGFVARGPEGAVYHSGDTAMFDGFVEIGERAGPIDWAMLPIGAYSPRWFMSPQHMNPEEAGEAFEMLGARQLLAMHWGTFQLTDEPLGEPPFRLRAWAERNGHSESRVRIPSLGEVIAFGAR